MPIYEYICADCNGRFQKLVGFNSTAAIACPRCGSESVRKAISRFAVVQSEDARLESLSAPSAMAGLDVDDPASVARWAKQMGRELGEEAGDDWDDTVDQMLDEELSGEHSSGGAASREDDLGWG
ncbi:MAG TPA: FmdB family zinc ribbon protein [Herpetosiphonaceae bacterium]